MRAVRYHELEELVVGIGGKEQIAFTSDRCPFYTNACIFDYVCRLLVAASHR